MKTLARERSKLFASLAAVLLSATSMIWLFWRHPVTAGLVTLVIFAAFGVSAYMARWIEPDSPDVGGFNQSR
jgi:hypothetical protein